MGFAVKAFVDRLLDCELPVWHTWDRDLDSLVTELTRVAHEFAPTPELPPLGKIFERSRFRRAIWLLDKLVQPNAIEVFEPLMANAKAVSWGDDRVLLAWGRRLQGPQRDRIVQLVASGSLHWMQIQAAVTAWCASCPNEEIASLLKWEEAWRPILKNPDQVLHVNYRPEAEFHRRCPDRRLRFRLFKAHLDQLAQDSGGDEVNREIRRSQMRFVLHWMLWDAAENSDCSCEASPEGLDWKAWLEGTLSAPAFSWVGPHEREFLRNDWHRIEGYVWIRSHGPEDWRKLCKSESYFREGSGANWGDCFFERLAEIVPSNEFGEWYFLPFCRPRSGAIRAFCRWLAPQYVEALRTHFDHPDDDWAQCSYHTYLAKASESILQHWWRHHRYRLPYWHVNQLDRRLFAPEAVRPAAIVEDVQDVENDVRLHDPFNWRGY